MNKFFLYARKSTDEPDRQILSIEAQITELKEFAKRERLDIIQTFIECKTAKDPGRPVFNEMLSLIEQNKASGILAWHPDRLARNSIDGGRIIYLVDTEKIKKLKFPTFWFNPTPQGKFMLNIAFGQSKYYIDNLSENVKRGLRQKVRRGELPGVAPTGYINDKVNHKIVKDPKRFHLVKKLFELYSTENYSLKDLRNKITDLGLLSRNNKILSVSNIQAILSRPFYYGAFIFNNELYQGSHKPMISKKLFDKCQEVMKTKARKTKRGQKEYAFRGLLKCAECGCSITSETQKGHNYYRCTKKRVPCSQKYIREELLAEQISNIIQKVSLNSAWADEMIENLDTDEKENAQAKFSFAQNLKNEIENCQNRLDKLLDAHLEGIISKDEYLAKKEKILNQKIENEQKLTNFEQKDNHWLKPAKKFILEAKQAQIIALRGNFSEKKNFLKKIGSNPLLREREILFTPLKAWKILLKFNNQARAGKKQKGEDRPKKLNYPLMLRD
ncbi:recombinase family protein [Candidatus Parcubacteria bacterium]|nr:recombinase family protein [Candidatus Parcubacteria bacterium]